MAQHDVVSDLTRATLRQPADLYIAHYDAALPAAAAAARRHGAIYAFDAEDFHPGDLADTPQNAFANRIIREMERRTLPACAYVTAASAGIARAYAAAYGVPSPRVVLNVFSRTEAPPSPSEAGTMSPGPSLYWFSQTIGPDRGLEWAVRAGAAAKSKPHLYLRGALAVGYEARLRALAEEVGAADRLHLLPLIGPADLIPQMAQFDLSYIGETGHTPNRRIALVNKLFSGLIAGVPAIATDIPAHADIVQACDGALFLFGLGDVEALTAQLDSLLLNPQRLRQARETAWRLGQERFNWELEEKTLVEIVDSALRARVKP
jgi:glycosyltransferase involved in cell wall biosynthesis